MQWRSNYKAKDSDFYLSVAPGSDTDLKHIP